MIMKASSLCPALRDTCRRFNTLPLERWPRSPSARPPCSCQQRAAARPPPPPSPASQWDPQVRHASLSLPHILKHTGHAEKLSRLWRRRILDWCLRCDRRRASAVAFVPLCYLHTRTTRKLEQLPVNVQIHMQMYFYAFPLH